MSDKNSQLVFPPKTDGPLYILAPFFPTPEDVVDRMLQLTEVTSEDVVYDLGCGDGRIVIAAAVKYGARGVGVDIEPYWVAQSQVNARTAGVEHLVSFEFADALSIDLSPATVVTLYLVQWSTTKIQPIIAGSVKRGARVISHSFHLGTWPSVKTESFIDATGQTRTLHLWISEGIDP
jgi:SAM-dependent methyltransferase